MTGRLHHLLHSPRVRFAAAGVLLAAALGTGTADAATPDSGTLTDTSAPATWSGGPFANDNASALLLSRRSATPRWTRATTSRCTCPRPPATAPTTR